MGICLSRLHHKITRVPRLHADPCCCRSDRNKSRRHAKYGLLQPTETPYAPWVSVSADFITKLPESHGFMQILVVVDPIGINPAGTQNMVYSNPQKPRTRHGYLSQQTSSQNYPSPTASCRSLLLSIRSE